MTEELVPYNAETGEVINESDAITPYVGASELRLADGEQEKLLAPFADEDVRMRDFDKLIYLPQVFFRERLNQVFGVGQWILKPVHASISPDKKSVFYHGQLYIRGCFVAEAIGEQKYTEGNAKTSYATAYEGAKSDCITRCCKDLGVAAELWKPQYSEYWKAKYGNNNAPAPQTEKTKPVVKGNTRRTDIPPVDGPPPNDIPLPDPPEMFTAPASGGMECPKCGAPMKARRGKDGPFYGCSTYPDCKGTRPA